MENELYHVRGHKYLKKILGKNGVYRYIYKLSSEKKAAKYQKLQKEAQDKYNAARNEYNKHMDESKRLNAVASNYAKILTKEYRNKPKDSHMDELSDIARRFGSSADEELLKATYAQNEAKWQAALIEEYYRAGIKARQDYLDFVQDSESLKKASKGKSFVSNLFSKIFKKKK